MKILLSLFAILIMAESCKSSKTATTETEKKAVMQTDVLSGTYIISAIENKTKVPKKLSIIFNAKSQTVSGFSGCNSFFSDYSITGNKIEFKGINTSKKYCPETMKIEKQILNALSKTKSFSIKDKVLTLKGEKEVMIKAIEMLSDKNIKDKTINTKNDIVEGNYDTSITYKASSRGYFDYITISKNKISISKDVNLKKIDIYKCNPEDWSELNQLLKTIDVLKLNKLKAPTDKHLYDGAAHTTLSVQQGDIIFITPSFDEGHPPKKIEALVNKVLSIKETLLK